MDYEFFTLGKYSFRKEIKPNFWKWMKQRYGKSPEEFLSLSPKHKKEIFLRWKWGLSDIANENLEITEQATLYHIKDMDTDEIKDEGMKWYIENKKKFNQECNRIKESIGLLEEKNITNSFVDKIMEKFDGEEI